MPTDNRATAERIAREVYEKMDGRVGGAIPVHMMTESVLAGMAHRDRTAEREAARKAWDARHMWGAGSFGSQHANSARARDRYLAAEFDAGERVTPEESAVWEAIGRYGAEVATSGRMAPPAYLTDAVKRLAEQRGAER